MKKPHEKLRKKLMTALIYASAPSSFKPQSGLHLSLKNSRKASYFSTGNT